MSIRSWPRLSRLNPWFLLVSLLILLVCLSFNLYYAFGFPDAGVTIDGDWVVIEVLVCESDPNICSDPQNTFLIQDRILSIGGITLEEHRSDRRISPFGRFEAGEAIPILVERAGTKQNITWEMQSPPTALIVERLVSPILIYLPFWIVGTALLLFVRTSERRRYIFVLVSYVTALWLAVGIISNSFIAHSSLIQHALSWIIMPVFIHYHLEFPDSLIGSRKKRMLLIPLYLAALVLASMELMQKLPASSYFVALLSASFGSILILICRLTGKSSPAYALAAKLMLSGIVLSLRPGILLWIVPQLLQLGSRVVITTSLSLLAIPALPLFYVYASYKHYLGVQESWIYILLARYAQFLVYITIFAMALIVGNRWLGVASEGIVLIVAIALSIFLAVFPGQGPFDRFLNRIAYGRDYQPDAILKEYSLRIPASTDQEQLSSLLIQELMPTLQIKQSALFLTSGSDIQLLYKQGIGDEDLPTSSDALRVLLTQTETYRPHNHIDHGGQPNRYDWVRLSVPLKVKQRTTGIWLFGGRSPDDYYRQEDSALLSMLASQTAVTTENTHLFQSLQRELVSRRQSEVVIQQLAERLRFLHEIDQAVLSATSVDEIAQVALTGLEPLIPFSRASITLFDFEDQRTRIMATLGSEVSPGDMPDSLPLEQYSNIPVLNEGQVWLVHDLTKQTEPKQLVKSMLDLGILSVLSAPLIADDQLIGAINLGSVRENAFDQEHVAIAREAAASVAIALRSAQLFTSVVEHRRDLQHLSAQLMRAQEAERERISHELHDQVGQMLTAITLNIASLQKEIPESLQLRLYSRLADTRELVHDVTEEIRELSLELRPAMLHDLGLIPTLRWYLKQQGKRLQIEIELEVIGLDERLSGPIETALYRVTQEAITNIARHAAASQVKMQLRIFDHKVMAQIIDDGRGFKPASSKFHDAPFSGVGIQGMRERLAALSGSLIIESKSGEGTTLLIEIPL